MGGKFGYVGDGMIPFLEISSKSISEFMPIFELMGIMSQFILYFPLQKAKKRQQGYLAGVS